MSIYIMFIFSVCISGVSYLFHFNSEINIFFIIYNLFIYLLIFMFINITSGWIISICYSIFFKIKKYKLDSFWIYPIFIDNRNKKIDIALFISFIWENFCTVSLSKFNNRKIYEKYEKDYNDVLKYILISYILYSIITTSIVYILSKNILLSISILFIFVAYLFIQFLGKVESMGTGVFYGLIDKKKLIYYAYKNLRIFNYFDKSIIYSKIINNIDVNKSMNFEEIDVIEQALIDSIYDSKKYIREDVEEKLYSMLSKSLLEKDINYMLAWTNVLLLYSIYLDKLNIINKKNMVKKLFKKVVEYVDEVMVFDNMPGVKATKKKVKGNLLCINNNKYLNSILYNKTYFYINISEYRKKVNIIKGVLKC